MNAETQPAGTKVTEAYVKKKDNCFYPVFFLCLFLGWFGAHRFYLKKNKSGILMLVTFGGCGLWWMIDIFAILLGIFPDNNGRPIPNINPKTWWLFIMVLIIGFVVSINTTNTSRELSNNASSISNTRNTAIQDKLQQIYNKESVPAIALSKILAIYNIKPNEKMINKKKAQLLVPASYRDKLMVVDRDGIQFLLGIQEFQKYQIYYVAAMNAIVETAPEEAQIDAFHITDDAELSIVISILPKYFHEHGDEMGNMVFDLFKKVHENIVVRDLASFASKGARFSGISVMVMSECPYDCGGEFIALLSDTDNGYRISINGSVKDNKFCNATYIYENGWRKLGVDEIIKAEEDFLKKATPEQLSEIGLTEVDRNMWLRTIKSSGKSEVVCSTNVITTNNKVNANDIGQTMSRQTGDSEKQYAPQRAAKELGIPLEKTLAKSGILLRLIPAGVFIMGSPMNEEDRNADEVQHEVKISNPFYMGKYEVTQGQWNKVMGGNPSKFKYLGDSGPADSVRWKDCQIFMRKLEKIEGLSEGAIRLPTEAEWEYACRAGTRTAFCNGDSLDGGMANIEQSRGVVNMERSMRRERRGTRWQYGQVRMSTMEVGSFKPNTLGLYDMHGNLSEWCLDWYGEYGGDASDPSGPVCGRNRVRRGGSWRAGKAYCRSAYRGNDNPDNAVNYVGFRLVLTAFTNAEVAEVSKSDAARQAGNRLAVSQTLNRPRELNRDNKESDNDSTTISQKVRQSENSGNAASQTESKIYCDKTDHQTVQQSQKLNEQIQRQTGELPSLADIVKDLKSIVAQATTDNGQALYGKTIDREVSNQTVTASKMNQVSAAPKQESAVLNGQDISSLVRSVATIATAELAKVEITKLEVPQQTRAQTTVEAPAIQKAQKAQTTPVTAALKSNADKSGLTMIRIPSGTFLMGSSDAPNEMPAHRVTVASFYMDESEVSQAAYQRVIGSPPRSFFKGPKLPVDSVKWPDAIAFCNARSVKEGLPPVYDNQGNVINWDGGGYRLPTEAEWEYACRAGTSTKYSSGDGITVQQANYDPNLGKKHPWFRARSMPVKSLPPNQFGLYDMHGNLWEWCQNYYGPYTANDATNPVGPAQGTAHVIRGGSWWNTADSARSAKRYDLGAQPMYQQCMGFRCVRSAK